jgi:cytoplasmic iron level regulating protein YaaA (DUF328/UPF0246 family)
MIILIHTSKTMRPVSALDSLHPPLLLPKARELACYMQTMSTEELARVMRVSPSLAIRVAAMYAEWNDTLSRQSLAIDSFVGDIYSGLQANTLSKDDREYAQTHLRILSGLYGILQPFDGISRYRLELAYRLPEERFKNLYAFWGDSVAKTLPASGTIINLASIEYSKLVTPFLDTQRFISPRFLTRDPKTGEPVFIVVHAKIARGAFARWLITSRRDEAAQLKDFSDIGYRFDPTLSTPNEPVFVCEEFGGKGLSMRLQGD